MWILFWTLIFFCGVKGGASLHCFNCSSDNDDECVILESSDTLSTYYTTCNGSCVLTKVVEHDNGQYWTRTVRECVNEIHPHGRVVEYLATTSGEKNKTYYCNTDGCNGEDYISEAVNLTTVVSVKPKRAAPLYCYQCSTRVQDEGCEDITSDTATETNPYYKLCEKGACGLLVLLEEGAGESGLDVSRICVKSYKPNDGCMDIKTPTDDRTKFKKGKNCMCRVNGCNAGNPLIHDIATLSPYRGKIVEAPSLRGLQPGVIRRSSKASPSTLMCYTCSSDSNPRCDTVQADDVDSKFYKQCRVKNAKCQFLFQQRVDGGHMTWVHTRECVSSEHVGCTDSVSEDHWKIPFPKDGFTYGCVCDTDGCNGGYPTSEFLYVAAEVNTSTTTAASGGSVSRPLTHSRLWTVVSTTILFWLWTRVGC